MNEKMSLSFEVLGKFNIILDGVTVDAGLWAKSQALLAYLIVEQDISHRRDTLAGILWSNKSNEIALMNLRQAISQLRKTFPSLDHYLHITPRTIQFRNENQFLSDVSQFLHLADLCEKHVHASRMGCSHCIKRLEHAMDLYKGPLLAGFFLKDAPEFDEWLAVERQSCETVAVVALTDMAEYYLEQGQYELAGHAAHRQTEIDPYREIAHRQYMRFLSISGQRTTVIQYYERFCDLLKSDLGIEPEAETIALYEQIRHDDRTFFDLSGLQKAKHLVEQSPSTGLRIRPVFVGRKKELSLLQTRYFETLKGKPQIVLIAGEAGWGKTALIDAFMQRLRVSSPNSMVAFGKGNAYTGIGDPYLPFREILEFLAGDVEARWAAGTVLHDQAYSVWKMMPVIAQIIIEEGIDLIGTFVNAQMLFQRVMALFASENLKIPAWVSRLQFIVEQRNTLQDASTPVTQKNLFEQYTRVLQKIAEQKPLILVLDDMHWMDTGSANLLFHLEKHLLNSRVLLIGAYRPTDLRINTNLHASSAMNPGESVFASEQPMLRNRHPLEYMINEFKRDHGHIEIMLSQNEEGFIDALIDSEPNDLGFSFRAKLQDRTQGHPLFAVELLQSMTASGGLVKDKSSRLVEGNVLNWEIVPAKMEAVIAERLERLPKHLLEVLKIASVEGEIFTAQIIAMAMRIDEDKLVHLLSGEIGKEHRLVRVEGVRWYAGKRVFQYRFDHILFQKYLYISLDPIERVHWHEKIGFSMESLFENELAEFATSLSWHFKEAENIRKAIHYLNLAGEKAMLVSANQEGIEYFTHALSLLETLPDSPKRAKQELTLQINLAVSILAIQSYTEIGVEKAFRRAQDLCNQIDDVSHTFPVLWQLACYRASCGEIHAGGELMLDLIQTGEHAADPLWIALGHWGKGWHDHWVGDYVSSQRHLQVTLDFYDPSRHRALAYLYSQDPGVTSRSVFAINLLITGYPEQALENSHIALELARQIGHPFSLALALAYTLMVFGFLGDYETLLQLSEELIDVTDKYGFVYWNTAGLFGRGWALSHKGQSEEALQLLIHSREIVRSLDIQVQDGLFVLIMVGIMIQIGKGNEGIKLLDQTLTAMRKIDALNLIFEIIRIRGEALLKLNPAQPDLAEAAFLESINLAREKKALFFELKTSLSLARLWVGQGKVTQTYSLLTNICGQFTEGYNRPDFEEAQKLIRQLEKEWPA